MRAAHDAGRLLADRPIRMSMVDGMHINVVQRISIEEARELIAELEASVSLAVAMNNIESTPRELPRNPDRGEFIAECEPAGTRDR